MPFRDVPHDFAIRPLAEVAWPGASTAPEKQHTSRFRANIARSYDSLVRELEHLDASGWTLYVPLASGSFDDEDHPIPDSPVISSAILLEFWANGHLQRFGADRYADWRDNLRAIALTLEALRAVDRYGLTPERQQYRGFTATP